MAGRLIPRKTKVQTQFYKNYTVTDAVLLLAFIILIAITVVSGISIRWWLVGVWALIFVLLMINAAPNTRVYQALGHLFKYLFGRRNYRRQKINTASSVQALMPYSGVLEDGLIDFKEYYGGVIEIFPVEFYMLSEDRQNAFISAVDNAIKTLSTEQVAMIVKTQRPMVLDKYIRNEENKISLIEEAKKNKVVSDLESQAREEIIQTRVSGLVACNVDTPDRLMKDRYYFVTFGTNRRALISSLELIANTIESGTNGSLRCARLSQKQAAVFLKNIYFSEIDEREIDELKPVDYMQWIMPDKIDFRAAYFNINGKKRKVYSIAEYPNTVRNAWGNVFFNIPSTTVVCKFRTVPQGDAEIRLDKSLMEMEEQIQKRQKASKQIEKSTHYESLQELLISLKSGNETLLDTNIFITVDDEQKKPLKTMLRRGGFKYNEMFGMQKDGFINANISRFCSLKRLERGINSSSLAAVFPFISDAVQDEKGIFIGYNSEPFFIDFFERGKERVNSNMVVMGKSGSGKSFAVSGLLAHLAADNSRIFVLDPEKEYLFLAKNLGGKVVDVGNATEGRINPFQIVTSLEDEGDSGQNVSLSAHLQFLEEFFKVILDGITKDALEVLNECVKDLYEKMGINEHTDISKLKPNKFPIFQDLYEYVIKRYEKEKDEFMKNNLKVIRTYIAKFAKGGRNANLWNGYSSITADENFIVFQFQTLLANKNNDIANAQMLLIMRWLENEVYKNKDYNAKYNTNRKIIVAIDEAHVFIDEKKPVALDFMFQLAKRIRKYSGMQIVISQSIKDFVGTPEIARKSTAIINSSQFSMIFSLAPNDINDLVSLYEKSGEINESEQENIVTNKRGTCFFIAGPYFRTNVDIIYSDNIVDFFMRNRIDAKGNFITGDKILKIKEEEKKQKEAKEAEEAEEQLENKSMDEQPIVETSLVNDDGELQSTEVETIVEEPKTQTKRTTTRNSGKTQKTSGVKKTQQKNNVEKKPTKKTTSSGAKKSSAKKSPGTSKNNNKSKNQKTITKNE